MSEQSTAQVETPARGLGVGISSILRNWSVPIFFLVISIAGIAAARLDINYLINEVVGRFGRNAFLVISLIIPVMAGLGLNFGIVIGAMAGQTALVIVTHYRIDGLAGFMLAAVISVPIAMMLGWLVGRTLNQAKGREMVTSMIMGFFANGIYQLVFLVLLGTLIPMKDPVLILGSGIGLRNTIDLIGLSYSLDRAMDWLWNGFVFTSIGATRLGPWRFPICTLLVIGILCVVTTFITRTKLGQEMRAVGQDMHIAQVAGINVDRTRIIATMMSTVLAAWGQLIFLQNIGTFNTYSSHEQVGMFSVAAILVGGATTRRATIWNAIVGTLLFHTLFVVSPLAGQRLFGVSQVGEYFRSFLAYGVIAVALALHAWQGRAGQPK